MEKKPYQIHESTPMTVADPAVAYSAVAYETLPSSSLNPNVPFHGTQEEWLEHFHRIEDGNFVTWEEHQKQFDTWKKQLFASLM